MDVRSMLDPEVVAALDQLPVSMAGFDSERLAVLRGFPQSPAPLPREVELREVSIPSPQGDVPVRVLRPAGPAAQALPAVLWIHGGGFVMGSASMDDTRLAGWVREFGCVAVAVDYRLAPETPFPGAFDDCCSALSWLHETAASLGVDPARIGVAGISAGGGLTAALALAARDRLGLPLTFQCLVYPMLDDRMKHAANSWDAALWPPEANRFGWAAYVGHLAPDVPPYAAPGRATDLSGLPPTLLAVGALDCFLDENVDYATRLMHSGVQVDLRVYAGGCHGIDSAAQHSLPGRQMRRDVENWLRRALARTAAGTVSGVSVEN